MEKRRNKEIEELIDILDRLKCKDYEKKVRKRKRKEVTLGSVVASISNEKVDRKILYKCMAVFEEEYVKKFGVSPRNRWTRVDWNKMKNAIKKYGREVIIDVIRYIIRNWDRLKIEWRMSGGPTIGVISVMGERVLPYVKKKDDGKDIGW
jgi:hypothetical protein